MASQPVASLILLAALPVGAARRILSFNCWKILRIAVMIVVLPVPGPPVITSIFERAASITASFCFWAKFDMQFLLNPLDGLFGVNRPDV